MNLHRKIDRLSRQHYDQPCKDLAVYLLGKILVRKFEDGTLLKGKIVETESYLGGEDKASHSYNGKITQRNEPMFMASGTAYVYMVCFGYHCLNISSKEPGAAVLIRALEPVAGEEIMLNFRVEKNKNYNRVIKSEKLCDGPSKLCLSFNITKDNFNKLDLADPTNHLLWIEESSEFTENELVITCPRIGIGPSGEEWVPKPLRYYIYNNKSVSKRNREAEERGDTIACLGETTGSNAAKYVLQKMQRSREGSDILKERPRINSTSANMDVLANLPDGTLGKLYSDFLLKNEVTPDSRLPVQFVDDVELAYVIQRYREVHDLVHTVLQMPTNMLGEVTVKWVEAIQTKFPMCIGGAIFGPIRLKPKHRRLYLQYYLPWALKTGTNAEFLLNIYFEKRWEQPVNDFYKEVNIEPLTIEKKQK